MLRGLKTLSLTATAVDVTNYSGHGLLHVARDGATGALNPIIEHSADGTTWTASGVVLTWAPGTVLATADQASAEFDVDGLKKFIRLGAASVGDVTLVLQARS
ncbi:hypothetical protein [Bradyrhizobium yuanmingense]|uniref:hypothetical protein n=1 Tax=Bradyrhizobium yuanmingense TaxID=108015 RepID=UPI0004BBE640|nr:hypothetical protein [Bradyrhizobium yuanmingense]